jgi:hypothetical protein
VTVTVDDAKFQAAFKKDMKRKSDNVRRGARGYCEAVVRIAKTHIHRGSGVPYGHLEDTLEVIEHLRAARPYITAGTKFYRARFLEWGWRDKSGKHHGPFPFLRPAVLEAERDFVVEE